MGRIEGGILVHFVGWTRSLILGELSATRKLAISWFGPSCRRFSRNRLLAAFIRMSKEDSTGSFLRTSAAFILSLPNIG